MSRRRAEREGKEVSGRCLPDDNWVLAHHAAHDLTSVSVWIMELVSIQLCVQVNIAWKSVHGMMQGEKLVSLRMGVNVLFKRTANASRSSYGWVYAY